MSSIKINFIQFFHKEKSGAVTKLKIKDLSFVSFKISKTNMWYTLVCLSFPCISRGKKTK